MQVLCPMYLPFRILVATASGFFPAIHAIAAEDSAAVIEPEIFAAHDAMIAAAESLDLGQLYDFVLDTDTVALVTNGRLIRTKAEAEASSRAGFQNLATIKYLIGERHVTALSANSALLIVDGSAEVATVDGRTFSAPFTQTIVLVLRDGKWRVLHTHQSAPSGQRN